MRSPPRTHADRAPRHQVQQRLDASGPCAQARRLRASPAGRPGRLPDAHPHLGRHTLLHCPGDPGWCAAGRASRHLRVRCDGSRGAHREATDRRGRRSRLRWTAAHAHRTPGLSGRRPVGAADRTRGCEGTRRWSSRSQTAVPRIGRRPVHAPPPAPGHTMVKTRGRTWRSLRPQRPPSRPRCHPKGAKGPRPMGLCPRRAAHQQPAARPPQL